MRIQEVRTTQVRVPLNTKAKWSGGTRETAPALLVELVADEGLVGLGECVGPSIPLLRAAVEEELKGYLTGADPMRTELLVHRMEEHAVNWPGVGAHAIAGLEIALLDLKAKALGVPLYELLGGAYRQEIAWAGYIFIDSPEVNARQAQAFLEKGFREIKVKVGRDPELDMRRLGAIREAVGSEPRIRIDVNQGWSVPTAIKWIRRMQQFDLQYVEQPTPWHDLEGMRRVSESVEAPIAADEGCTTLRSALDLIEHRACSVFVIYVSEAGGLVKAKEIAAVAAQAGIACCLGTWAELGVGTMAGAHLLAASRNFPFANDTHYHMQDDDILTEMIPFSEGRLRLSRTPGLGVALDPARVEHYARCQGRDSVFYDASDPSFTPGVAQML